MDDFKNVKLVAKANVYEGGKVTSRTFYTPEGDRKTLGFMMAGTYSFGTGAPEVMEMLAGDMDVKLPGETEYKNYKAGDSYSIPGNSSFDIIVKEWVDYCCSYADPK